MLYAEYQKNFPTGKIDIGEWRSSPEGFAQVELDRIIEREKFTALLERNPDKAFKERITGEYLELFKRGLDAKFVPQAVFNDDFAAVLYERDFNQFTKLDGYMVDRFYKDKIPKDELIEIISHTETIQPFFKRVRETDFTVEEKLELLTKESTHGYIKYRAFFAADERTEPKVAEFILSDKAAKGDFRQVLLESAMMSKENLLREITDPMDSSRTRSGIAIRLIEMGADRDFVVKRALTPFLSGSMHKEFEKVLNALIDEGLENEISMKR